MNSNTIAIQRRRCRHILETDLERVSSQIGPPRKLKKQVRQREASFGHHPFELPTEEEQREKRKIKHPKKSSPKIVVKHGRQRKE